MFMGNCVDQFYLHDDNYILKRNVAFRKKAIYIHLTVVFGLSLLGLVIFDFIMVDITQNGNSSTDLFFIRFMLHMF